MKTAAETNWTEALCDQDFSDDMALNAPDLLTGTDNDHNLTTPRTAPVAEIPAALGGTAAQRAAWLRHTGYLCRLNNPVATSRAVDNTDTGNIISPTRSLDPMLAKCLSTGEDPALATAANLAALNKGKYYFQRYGGTYASGYYAGGMGPALRNAIGGFANMARAITLPTGFTQAAQTNWHTFGTAYGGADTPTLLTNLRHPSRSAGIDGGETFRAQAQSVYGDFIQGVDKGPVMFGTCPTDKIAEVVDAVHNNDLTYDTRTPAFDHCNANLAINNAGVGRDEKLKRWIYANLALDENGHDGASNRTSDYFQCEYDPNPGNGINPLWPQRSNATDNGPGFDNTKAPGNWGKHCDTMNHSFQMAADVSLSDNKIFFEDYDVRIKLRYKIWFPGFADYIVLANGVTHNVRNHIPGSAVINNYFKDLKTSGSGDFLPSYSAIRSVLSFEMNRDGEAPTRTYRPLQGILNSAARKTELTSRGKTQFYRGTDFPGFANLTFKLSPNLQVFNANSFCFDDANYSSFPEQHGAGTGTALCDQGEITSVSQFLGAGIEGNDFIGISSGFGALDAGTLQINSRLRFGDLWFTVVGGQRVPDQMKIRDMLRNLVTGKQWIDIEITNEDLQNWLENIAGVDGSKVAQAISDCIGSPANRDLYEDAWPINEWAKVSQNPNLTTKDAIPNANGVERWRFELTQACFIPSDFVDINQWSMNARLGSGGDARGLARWATAYKDQSLLVKRKP